MFRPMNERQWVTLGTFVLAIVMLFMPVFQPGLWREELFKTLITVVVVTGLVNMVLAFHYTANKSDEGRMVNTGKAFDAIKAQADSTAPAQPAPDVVLKPGETAQAEPS